jgi:DNA-binding winged helix-turn-helix (wHTH) protein
VSAVAAALTGAAASVGELVEAALGPAAGVDADGVLEPHALHALAAETRTKAARVAEGFMTLERTSAAARHHGSFLDRFSIIGRRVGLPFRKMVYAFGAIEVDERLCEVRRGGAVVHVQPKVFDLLLLLAKAGDRVVPKEEIHQRVWQGVSVGEASIWRLVQEARRAIGDEPQETIVTVRGRGFRLALPVTQIPPAEPKAEARDAVTASAPKASEPAYLTAAAARVERARAGEGSLLWLSGERGIGKTAALADVGRRAEALGASVRAAHTRQRQDVPPFWIWREALPELDGALPRDSTGQLEGAAQFSLFESIARILSDIAARDLLVLMFDDVHWADQGSLELLEFVVPTVGRTRIVVVATYHDASLEEGGRTRALVRAMGHPSSVAFPLRSLSLGEIAALVERATGSQPPEHFAKSLLERSGGNPLYARRILETDWAWKALHAKPGERVTTMDVPKDMIQTISQHIGALSPPALDLLTTAAVLGSPLDFAKLGVVTALPASDLLARLDEAVRSQVLRRDRHGQLRFAHLLVRDVLYKGLSSAQRTRRHAEAAQRLLAHYGTAWELHLIELADHFALALPDGDVERSIELSMRVAQSEAAAGRPLAAAHYWAHAARALALLPGGDPRQLEVSAGLAEAQRPNGRTF